MNVRREGSSFVAEDAGTIVGYARLTGEGGVVLELREPRESVALALFRAATAELRRAVDTGDRLPSFGSVHLQTDNQGAVVQAVSRLVPRVFRSDATIVSPPRNGWVAVYDEVADRDPRQLARLGRELSNATGLVVFTIGVEDGEAVHYIAYERGRILDEYLSVPHYRGEVAPGDAVALRANPTVVARLTGADPASIRAVARTAESPAQLPPAEELISQLADVLGLEGADYGAEAARALPEAATVRHA